VARRDRPDSGPLDARARTILRAVIDEYVATATPVGSQMLVERYPLGVSSATVRAVLADLERAGLLAHPHTSAGRVPTDAGYRFYVESIIDMTPLPPVEQLMIRHQFGQVELASEQWFRLAATTLAASTRSAAIATPAKPRSGRVRRIDLVTMQEHLASLILVLQEGTIKQCLVGIAPDLDQEDLSAIATGLTVLFSEKTADEALAALDTTLEAQLAAAGVFDAAGGPDGATEEAAFARLETARRVGERVVRVLREFDAAMIEEVFSDGLLNVMSAPEFAQSEKLRQVFVALENRAYLGELLTGILETGGVRVFIGSENSREEMHDVSLILAPYGRPGRAVGVVGVLGPTRMSYRHSIGSVRFVSALLNELVDHLYA
jgi:heat-inducible transcriptional repressor